MKSSPIIIALGLFIHPLCANALQMQPSQQKLEIQTALKLGETQTRTLAPDAIHVWRLALEAGQYAVIRVAQKVIDVVVGVVDSQGVQRFEVDGPTGKAGVEKANWLAQSAGVWKIEIVPVDAIKPGDYEIKLDILRRATAQDQQIVEADSLTNVAYFDYFSKAKYLEAEPLYRHAVDILEKVLGPDHADVAASLNGLAEVYRALGKYHEAETLMKRCLAIWEKAFGSNDHMMAVALQNLAKLYKDQGKYPEAEQHAVRSLAIQQSILGPDDLDIANISGVLAEIYRYKSEFAKADSLRKRALAIQEKTLGKFSKSVASSLNNLALSYDQQGKHAEAEPVFKRCLAIWEKVLGPDNSQLATPLYNLSRLYMVQGKYAEAEPVALRALTIDEKARGPTHPDVGLDLMNLASLCQAQSKYEKADSLYRQAIDILKKSLGSDNLHTATGLRSLASLCAEQGKYAEAESLLTASLQIQERVLGPNHIKIALTLTDLTQAMFSENSRDQETVRSLIDRAIHIFDANTGWPRKRVEAYVLRARLLKDRGRLPDAMNDLAEALRSSEALRPQIGGGEETRAGFFEKYSNHFDRMVAWQLEVGQIEKALAYAERGRARIFLDQLAVAQIDLLNSIPEEAKHLSLEKRQMNTKARMAEYQQRLNLLPSRKDLSNEEKNQQITALKDSLKLTEKDYQQIWEEIKIASPLWQGVITSGGQPVSLATIQRALVPKNGLLLFYQIGNEGSYLFVIPPGDQKPEVLSLQFTDQNASILQVKTSPLTSIDLQKILVGGNSDDSSAGLLEHLKTNPDILKVGQEKTATAKLQALWHALIPDSLWSGMKQCTEVIIIPDGLLHLLPFEALVVQSGATPADTRYWIDEGPVIRYAPSATILHSLEKRQTPQPASLPAKPSILSLSDPIFDLAAVATEMRKQIVHQSAAPRDSIAKPAAFLETLLAESRSKALELAGPLPKLPGTAIETDYIRQHFGAKNVDVLQQFQADEPHLRAQIEGKRCVHLATHGLVELQHSSLSNALALTPPPEDTVNSENDGFLKLYEIYELNLQACELAVLSACETHFGRFFKGEGVFALSRGFLAAGAARVVASHWQVQDLSTAELVGAFFRTIATAENNGRPVDYAQALRDAKLKLRRDKNRPQWSSPYFWAPFVITGKK